MRIQTKIRYDSLALAILYFIYCQFLFPFDRNKANAIISVGIALFGIALCILKRIRFKKQDVNCVIVALIALVYSRSSEGIRYFLLLLSWIMWAKFQFNNLLNFVYILVLTMACYSVPQLVQGVTRITGFSTSPPQAACVLLVCETYMMVYMANAGKNWKSLLLSCLCIFLIFETGTRSNLVAGILVFAFFCLRVLLNNRKIKNNINVFWVVLLFSMAIMILLAPTLFPMILSKLGRGNATESTGTRIYIYKALFEQILQSPQNLLIGSKGGFVEIYLKQILGTNEYFPGHQDYLVILCEYGLVGLVTVFYVFLKKHTGWLYFFLVFTVCSFHNIMLSGTTMMLMLITMTDLERKSYTIFPK